MDESLLHKLSLLGVHKLSLSYNSLLQNFQGRRRGSKELKPREKPYKNYKHLLISPLFSIQSFLAGPSSVFIGLRRRIQNPGCWRKIWDPTNLKLPQIHNLFAAKQNLLGNRFLVQVGYEVVIHVAFQNLELLRRILWILGLNLGFTLGLELISLIIAN